MTTPEPNADGVRSILEALGAPGDAPWWVNWEGGIVTEARTYVGSILEKLQQLKPAAYRSGSAPEEAVLAMKSTISFHDGDRPAIVVRFSCSDEPLEVAFTPGGQRWRPDYNRAPSPSFSISGRLIWRAMHGVA